MSDAFAITMITVYQVVLPYYSFELNTYSPSPRQDTLEECFGKAEPSMVAASAGG
jgi:hypothetical protein